MRDAMPLVHIRLVDPSSRVQGVDLSGQKIPVSRYAEVVELPKLPERSRVHAIELCGAEPGQYELTVYEHGDQLYRISANADLDVSMAAILHAREGRVRNYRFRLGVEEKKVSLTWLDNKGHLQLNIGENDW
jgi:hypothetical protein